MGNTWITDADHAEHLTHPLGLHLRRIIQASAGAEQCFLYETKIPCRRRPARKPCTGLIRLQRMTEEDQLYWHCHECGDNGVISEFQAGAVFRDAVNSGAVGLLEALSELYLSIDEAALVKECLRCSSALGLLEKARPLEGKGFFLTLKLLEAQSLLASLHECGHQITSPEEQKRFDAILERLDEDIYITQDLLDASN